jgi:hypothetical protein
MAQPTISSTPALVLKGDLGRALGSEAANLGQVRIKRRRDIDRVLIRPIVLELSLLLIDFKLLAALERSTFCATPVRTEQRSMSGGR